MSRRTKILAKTAGMYIGDKVDSIKNFFKADKKRVDVNLPLGISINSMINISRITSIWILNRENIVMKKPVSNSGTIIAISTADLSEKEDESLIQYRAFILPDNGIETDVYVLEVGVENKQVISTRIWTLNNEFFPESADEIAAWIDGDEEAGDYPHIGGPDLGTPWEKTYNRIWEPEVAQPIVEEYNEKIISDPFGDKTDDVTNIMSLYGRYLGESENAIVEYLSATAIEDDGSIEIELWLGIDINEGDIEII